MTNIIIAFCLFESHIKQCCKHPVKAHYMLNIQIAIIREIDLIIKTTRYNLGCFSEHARDYETNGSKHRCMVYDRKAHWPRLWQTVLRRRLADTLEVLGRFQQSVGVRVGELGRYERQYHVPVYQVGCLARFNFVRIHRRTDGRRHFRLLLMLATGWYVGLVGRCSETGGIREGETDAEER